MAFKKATKSQSKLRAAFFGPAGAGKSYTSLRVATGLGGPIAVIDSERGSASLYADRFDFDVCELEKKTIAEYCAVINDAAKAGYNVLVIDSLSHAWQELLEEVEALAKTKYRGNTWSAWSEGTPKQRRFIDAILRFPGHVIATMRSRTEWHSGEGKNGKTQPIRVGLAPEQGKMIEFEFTILLEINTEHMATVIKDRTGKFQDAIIDRPSEDFGRELAAWLAEGVPIIEAHKPASPPPPAPAPAPSHRRDEGESAWLKFAATSVSEFNTRLDDLYDFHEVPSADQGKGKSSVTRITMAIADLAVERGAPKPGERTPEWASDLASRLYRQHPDKVASEVRNLLEAEYQGILKQFDADEPAAEPQASADDLLTSEAGARG